MILYPAIDIINGQCVRLRQGDFQQQTTYQMEPLALATDYAAAGAEWLHIVDLDASRDGSDANLPLIAGLAANLDIKIQTGGGVRSETDIEKRLAAGVNRVVVGSLAVEQPQQFRDWLADYGSSRLVAAVDVRLQQHDGQQRWLPATHGWQQQSAGLDLFELLEQLCTGGLQHLLCTDIGRDGMLQGPNIKLYQQLRQRFPNLSIQASGGVAELENIATLQQHNIDGLVIGKALLDGRFELREALEIARRPET